jgi:hypothetical protein
MKEAQYGFFLIDQLINARIAHPPFPRTPSHPRSKTHIANLHQEISQFTVEKKLCATHANIKLAQIIGGHLPVETDCGE